MVLNIGSFEHRKLNRIGKDYIITIRICTVVVVLFFTHLQGARTALAKRELHWYLPNRVRQIPTYGCFNYSRSRVSPYAERHLINGLRSSTACLLLHFYYCQWGTSPSQRTWRPCYYTRYHFDIRKKPRYPNHKARTLRGKHGNSYY